MVRMNAIRIVFLILLAAICNISAASSWEFVGEFSDANNPNGPWSYGWGTGLNDFDAYNLVQPYAPGGGPMWLETEGDQAKGPILWKNNSSAVSYGVLPGEIAQHPSEDGKHCKVRWTAPAISEAYLRITGLWGTGDGGERDFWVVKNGSEVLFEVTGAVGDVPCSLFLASQGTSTIDFIQGRGALWGYENTPFSLNITSTDTLTCREKGEYYPSDMNRDCVVDLQDFILFAEDWLLCYDPDDSACENYADILSRKEMAKAGQWIAEKFVAPQPEPLFSFVYNGVSSAAFLPGWQFASTSAPLDEHRMKYTLIYTDPATALQVRCEAVTYDDFPTAEWTVYFKNNGTADTPILEKIQAIDTVFEPSLYGDMKLHRTKGDFCSIESYHPYVEALLPDVPKTITPAGGRPTNYEFPYFNIETGNEGLIYVLSWAGQWSTRFLQNSDNSLHITGGQELTHFTLHPGEEVRTPLAVVQFYAGDWIRAQNIWRRWMVAYNLPRPNGQVVQPQMSLCPGNYYGPTLMSNAAQEKYFIQYYAQQNVDFDYWWQDAGWYPCDGVGWPKTGTWECDPVRFPNGIREVSDFARSFGKKTIIWFEPERVHPDTWLSLNHPEWIYGGSGGGLLKLGDPACRAWLIDHIDTLLTEQGIDFYRQDFNIDPLGYWRGNDAADRQGITEVYHVMGYFEYWDALISRHPGLLIDSCASGGRRNDLETMRRAVPLLRSDYYSTPEGQQCHTYGMAFWLPFQGTGFIGQVSEYWARSSWVAELTFGPGQGQDIETTIDWDQMRRVAAQWRQLAPYFYGDFYPLTDYTTSTSVWMAWQYNLPDAGKGAVQVFRRNNAAEPQMTFQLKGLDSQAFYTLTNLDVPGEVTRSGSQLMSEGLTVPLPDQPGSAIIIYERR